MKTIHLIGNAHLDPIWLWPWTSGLDEVLATCRSACERLEANGELYFSRGEAWVYRQVELLDPALFARIRRHIETGRWEIVGGWWIQPDCNLPGGELLARQMALGRDYFESRFGRAVRIGYNVDSFGHAASLPRLMRQSGQDAYVMMRPEAWEKTLPARLFRWRGQLEGPEVLVFRISGGYGTFAPLSLEQLEAVTRDLPEGVEETCFFFGIGDHGGGPTQQQIDWLREHQRALTGWQLEFSTLERFFQRVRPLSHLCPLVVGELQHHAVGCYSVTREVKTAVRRAEHKLAQIGLVAGMSLSHPPPLGAFDLTHAWQQLCFHAFHDTLGGTCLPSAYQQVLGELEGLNASAESALAYRLRQELADAPGEECQRLVFWNLSEGSFDGLVTLEPWLERVAWDRRWQILDENRDPVAYQLIETEAMLPAGLMTGILVALKLAPGQKKSLRIDTTGAEALEITGASVRDEALVSPWGSRMESFQGGGRWELAGLPPFIRPHLLLIDDPSDTWSHGLDRYGSAGEEATWEAQEILETGPLRASLLERGRIGQSPVQWEWRVYGLWPWIDLVVRVNWRERHRVLKLVLELPAPLVSRWDGIPGEALEREADGRERPVRDWTWLDLGSVGTLGVVAPEVFALDASPTHVRWTLLRSPVMAHHEVAPRTVPWARWADEGVHDFRFRWCRADRQELDEMARAWQRPPLMASLTKGMGPQRALGLKF